VAIGWRSGLAGTNETRGKLTIMKFFQQDGKTQLQATPPNLLPERDYQNRSPLAGFWGSIRH